MISKRRNKLINLKCKCCDHIWIDNGFGKNDFKNGIFLKEQVCNKCGDTRWVDYDGTPIKAIEFD